MKTVSVLVLIISTAISPSFSDEAPMPYPGVTLGPFLPTLVRMVEEEVWIEVQPHRVDVRAEFYFTNTAETETLQVGFPDVVMAYSNSERSRISSDGPHGYFGEPTLKDVRITVNGELVETSFASTPKGYYRGWILFDAVFPKDTEVTSTVEYWVEPTVGYFRGLLADQNFRYVLKTGAGWAGTIGKATIHMAIDPDIQESQIKSITPYRDYEDDRGLHWEFTDFEPHEDIRIAYQAYTPHTRIRQLQAYICKEKDDQPMRRIAKRENIGHLGNALTDLYLCAWLIDDYETMLMACDWALLMEAELENLPNRLANEYDSWGQLTINWSGNDLPWEMAKAMALIRLDRMEEAREYTRKTALTAIESYFEAHSKKTKGNWYYRTYLSMEAEFDCEAPDVHFPDARSIKCEYTRLRNMLGEGATGD